MPKLYLWPYLLFCVTGWTDQSLTKSNLLTEKEQHETIPSSQIFSKKILDRIQQTSSIPGLSDEEIHTLKADITKTWNTLFDEGCLEVVGTDRDIRPIFVALQGIIEQALCDELHHSISNLQGIIHTPMPATPLCTNGTISQHLVDPSISKDPSRLFTVQARTTVVRDFLAKGGHLSIAYPKEGFNKRSKEQQKIYQEELNKYPDHLVDMPLTCSSIPLQLVGASYIFQDMQNNSFLFSIQMTQAKDPLELGHFGLWFGNLEGSCAKKRIKTVALYLEQNGAILPPPFKQ